MAFRHELTSLLLLDRPLRFLLTAEQDLARYLVLAHHGKLRVQVRAPGDVGSRTLLGLEQDTIWSVPSLCGPFALAYLETVVRIAGWRASAGMDVAQ